MLENIHAWTPSCSASNDSCDYLTPEHRTRWDLHIVAKLEVACEVKCLGHGNITSCLEHHHCDWAAGKGVSNNHFCDDIKPNCLIRQGQDHTVRDSVYDC